MPEERADDLAHIARILTALETQAVKQRDKARMLLEWQGKKTATKPQHEPDGLFAHEQGLLI